MSIHDDIARAMIAFGQILQQRDAFEVELKTTRENLATVTRERDKYAARLEKFCEGGTIADGHITPELSALADVLGIDRPKSYEDAQVIAVARRAVREIAALRAGRNAR